MSEERRLYDIDKNGTLALHLHKGQGQAWESPARIVAIIAGTQSGKTSFIPWWLWNEIKKRGDGDYLAVSATYDLFKLKFLPEMQRVFCQTSFGGKPWGAYKAGDQVIESLDGKRRIILRAASSEGGLESATAKAAVFDECGQPSVGIDAYEAIMRRLSLEQGRLLLATTPYNMGWLKTEIYDRWRAGDKSIEVIQFDSTVNPAFPLAEYEERKRVMPAWKFAMFYRGEFERPEGLIYSVYDEAVHKVAPFEIPAEWPRYVGIDFGAIHTALVWIAEDVARKAYYIYRVSLDGNMTTAEHARRALRLAETERVVAWYGGAASEKQPRWDWQSAGVYVQEPPVTDVEAQIDRAIGLFKERRLFIFDNEENRGLFDELGRYSRELDANGQPTEKIKDKETFHRLDAVRYGLSCANSSGPAFIEL